MTAATFPTAKTRTFFCGSETDQIVYRLQITRAHGDVYAVRLATQPGPDWAFLEHPTAWIARSAGGSVLRDACRQIAGSAIPAREFFAELAEIADDPIRSNFSSCFASLPEVQWHAFQCLREAVGR